MKRITVFGPGCMKCKKTEEAVRQVLVATGVEAVVEHVTDMQAIVAAGVMSTPAVAVDDTLDGGQANAAARILFPRVQALENHENDFRVFRRNANAVVSDRELPLTGLLLRRNANHRQF